MTRLIVEIQYVHFQASVRAVDPVTNVTGKGATADEAAADLRKNLTRWIRERPHAVQQLEEAPLMFGTIVIDTEDK